MSKVIIICGLPGVGKTTLADALSQKLGIFCLHKDVLKESLFESFGMSSLEASKKLGYPSVKALFDVAENNIARGIDVILESPLTAPEDKAVFEEWKKKYNVDFFVVVLQLNQESRKQRFYGRERHRAHHDNDRLWEQEKSCSYEHMPEKKIFLETSQPTEKLIQEIVNFLD